MGVIITNRDRCRGVCERGGKEGVGGGSLPLFSQSLGFFCDHFEELPIVFIEVKLIISNARFDISLLKYYQKIFST